MLSRPAPEVRERPYVFGRHVLYLTCHGQSAGQERRPVAFWRGFGYGLGAGASADESRYGVVD
jgi:hypothetical protein